MAAGITVEAAKVERFARFMNEALAEEVARALAAPVLYVDGVVLADAMSGELLQKIDAAGPYGTGNPEPLFVLPSARAIHAQVVGNGHVRATLIAEGRTRVSAIAFRAAPTPMGQMLLAQRQPFHAAGHVRADTWRGNGAVQLILEDLAAA